MTQVNAEGKIVEREYWIVNPKGAVHQVSRAHALSRLQSGPGWRMATAEEIKRAKTPNRVYRSGGEAIVQAHDRPFGKAFEPDVDVDVVVEGFNPVTGEFERETVSTTTKPGGGLVQPEATKEAQELAEQYNLNLMVVKGSGEGGRILKGDAQSFLDNLRMLPQEPEPEEGDEGEGE